MKLSWSALRGGALAVPLLCTFTASTLLASAAQAQGAHAERPWPPAQHATALKVAAKPAVTAAPAAAKPAGVAAPAVKLIEETIEFGAFGKVALYHQSATPQELVLFVSGDGGWNLGVVDMARELADTGAMVAGIDIVRYIKAMGAANGKCSYPAAQFEALSQYLQQKYHFAHYRPPVLVGYSSGATLIYATLVQAPPNTFKGGISLGFCPDLPLNKPMCKGTGNLSWHMDPKHKNTYLFEAANLPQPWVALQGTIDQVCDPPSTEAYVKQVGNGSIVMLPKVGHGFSVPRNWMPQFKDTYAALVQQQAPTKKSALPPEVSDLPLEVLPLAHSSKDYFAVIVSGDGGWAGIDKELGDALNQAGIHVVGLNSLQYFWAPKTPEQASKDLSRILRHFSSQWQQPRALLIGYSRGADVLPFMINRLPQEDRDMLLGSALLGADAEVEFQFHLSDWIGGSSSADALPVLPELKKLADTGVQCIYGEDETADSLCPQIDPQHFSVVKVQGGHHFGGNYRKLAEMILQHAQQRE